MRRIDQLIMIIPVVLNLKGNLEMNLSARLGTAANIGDLDKPETQRQIILGNLSLLQLQAMVVSFVAACVSFILGFIVPKISPARQGPGKHNDMASSNVTMRIVPRFASGVSHIPRRPRPPFPVVGDHRSSGFAEQVFSCYCPGKILDIT